MTMAWRLRYCRTVTTAIEYNRSVGACHHIICHSSSCSARTLAMTPCRYDVKLGTERETGLRLKGECGILKKKFKVLEKEIEEHKEDVKTLFEQKKELY